MFSSSLVLNRELLASASPASSARSTWKGNFMHNADKSDYWLEIGKDKNPASGEPLCVYDSWVQATMTGRPEWRI